MKYFWEKIYLRYRLNKDKYFKDADQNLFVWSYLLPGVSPILLHSTMFLMAIEKLGSDE